MTTHDASAAACLAQLESGGMIETEYERLPSLHAALRAVLARHFRAYGNARIAAAVAAIHALDDAEKARADARPDRLLAYAHAARAVERLAE